MCHAFITDEHQRPALASLMQLVRVVKCDNFVPFSVNDECRTTYFAQLIHVVKLLLHDEPQKANEVPGYSPNGCVSRHDHERAGVESASQPASRTTSHGATENQNVFFCQVRDFLKAVMVNVLSVFLDFGFAGLSVISVQAVAWVLYS